MAKRIFPRFVNLLAVAWAQKWPGVALVEVTYAPEMPRASTFYAGASNKFGKHVFINLQHSSKVWAVGEFTVNIILSSAVGPPARRAGFHEELERGDDASYRMGNCLYRKDKWWCLLPADDVRGRKWRATSYSDEAQVFQEAAADVTKDIEAIFAWIEHRAG